MTYYNHFLHFIFEVILLLATRISALIPQEYHKLFISSIMDKFWKQPLFLVCKGRVNDLSKLLSLSGPKGFCVIGSYNKRLITILGQMIY